MIQREAVFRAGGSLTPELAAKITDLPSKFDAGLQIEYRGARFQADSLISVLAMELYPGARLSVLADGPEAEAAAAQLVKLLEG
ncbi:MAG: HPr family phosphocarrier protein [Clostridiales bacterium]|nr:HPr family phosphocarrier protein [Clostridiales bacterium]